MSGRRSFHTWFLPWSKRPGAETMSPEQAEGKPVDHRSDLFSLGSVLYAMCTWRGPFRANGSMAILKRVCERAPTPIREINTEIPEWLAGLVSSKSPIPKGCIIRRRPTRLVEFQAALGHLSANHEPEG